MPARKPAKIQRVCAKCGGAFFARRPSDVAAGNAKFCSRTCRDTHRRPLTECFWEKVTKSEEPDGCWVWSGATNGRGYGQISVDGKLTLAHRVSWGLHFGPVPEGLFVLHDCPGGDNRSCVNPAHLWLGTSADNNADMVAKGRHISQSRPDCLARGERNGSRTHPEKRPRGEGHAAAKLSEEDVRTIRRLTAAGLTRAEIARRFGVTGVTISSIVLGKTWRHLGEES